MQPTPPGSGRSIVIEEGVVPDMVPGSIVAFGGDYFPETKGACRT